MKHFLLTTIAFLTFAITCKAQNTPWPTSGHVGIGTLTPAGPLQIEAGIYTDFLTTGITFDIGLRAAPNEWARAFRVVNSSASNGTDGGAFGVLGSGTTPTFAYMAIPTADPTGYNSTKILVLNNSGNVGIGTTNPGSYKLAVNGGIHSQSVNVDMTGWSDYVFKQGYNLPTLQEVNTYIDKNHHLPEIPSEQEVAKNGINLGEMNKLLLKKVEELTLYLIEQNKKLEKQQKEIEQLRRKQ
jgi:hypothetical protein